MNLFIHMDSLEDCRQWFEVNKMRVPVAFLISGVVCPCRNFKECESFYLFMNQKRPFTND